MLAIFSGVGILKRLFLSSLKEKRKSFSCLVFKSSINREIRHFHVVVVHLPFCHSRCRHLCCLKILFEELEKILVRAAKIIFGLDWYTSSDKELDHANWFFIK